jgi:hypothetical protein
MHYAGICLLLITAVDAFPPTPFKNGVLVNLTGGPRDSPFCSWTLTTAGALTNDGSRLCLTAFDASTPNRPVFLSSCNGDGSQLWTWVGAELDGALMYVGPNARGQECATGVDPLKGPPSQLTLAPCSFAPWQQLTSDSDGNGTLVLENLPNGRYFVCSPSSLSSAEAAAAPPASRAAAEAPTTGAPARGPEARDALAAAAAPPAFLYTYNATYAYALGAAAGYEEVTLLAALAGIANRAAPTLLLNLEAPDAVWLARATAPGGWLAGTALLPIAPPIENLLAALAAVPAGVVLFHPDIPCTSAIANTAAGAEDLLPIALRVGDPASLYNRLVAGGPRLPVRRTLPRFTGNISGSVKRDAYAWAVDTYLASGLSSPFHLGYYVDYYWAIFNRTEGGAGYEKATIPNLDYVVAQRGFFFDLSVWGDEAPVDEPAQPLGSDLAALRYVLDAAAAAAGGRAITVAHGFTPWAYKYVAPWGKHGGVEAEWATCRLFSAFNVLDDGDACCIGGMANAALWRLFPLADRYVQAAPPSRGALQARGLLDGAGAVVGHRLYYMFYAGDYDSAAWLYSQLLPRWEDPARGSVPIGWAVDPGLAARFPVVYPHLFSTLTPLDNIITGDSGAGYLNPTMLYGDARAGASGLPDGWPPWAALNTALNRQFNVRFTGFVIAGDAPLPGPADDARFTNFSALGIVNQGWPSLGAYLNGSAWGCGDLRAAPLPPRPRPPPTDHTPAPHPTPRYARANPMGPPDQCERRRARGAALYQRNAGGAKVPAVPLHFDVAHVPEGRCGRRRRGHGGRSGGGHAP